jgi:hypothetical protein
MTTLTSGIKLDSSPSKAQLQAWQFQRDWEVLENRMLQEEVCVNVLQQVLLPAADPGCEELAYLGLRGVQVPVVVRFGRDGIRAEGKSSGPQ